MNLLGKGSTQISQHRPCAQKVLGTPVRVSAVDRALCREPQGGSGRKLPGGCLEEAGLELRLGQAGASRWGGLGRGAGGRRHRQQVMEQGAGGPPGGRHLALPTPVQSRGGHKPRLKNIHA